MKGSREGAKKDWQNRKAPIQMDFKQRQEGEKVAWKHPRNGVQANEGSAKPSGRP